MDFEFKKGANLSKENLIEQGKAILRFISEVELINAKIRNYQDKSNCIIDTSERYDLTVSIRELKEAISLIQTKIGETELRKSDQK